MTTIKALPGDMISEVAAKAVQMVVDGESAVSFDFNGIVLTAIPGMSVGDIRAAYDAGMEKEREAYMAPERVAERERLARIEEETRRRDFASLVAFVKTADEKELRESADPWPRGANELEAYVAALTDRTHDYGTCVYAMSLASVATFNYVAHRLGTTGFQSSCADLDVLRRTRHLEGGFQIVDHDKLLYPQYLTDEHFPSRQQLLYTHRAELAKRAQGKLDAAKGDAHSEVISHWKMLVAAGNDA